MDSSNSGDSTDLDDLLAVIQARKWTFLLMFIVALATMAVLSYRKTPLYEAQARVFVQAFPPAVPSPVQPPNLQTESELVASEPVAARVIDDLDLDESPDSLVSGLSVEVLPDTEVLLISYTSTDAAFARDAANSFTDNYIEYRRDRALETLFSTRTSIQSRVDAVQDQLVRKTEELQKALQRENDALARRLEGVRSVLTTRLGLLQQRLDDVARDRSVTHGGSQVIETANMPSTPVSPNHRRDLTLGVIMGLILASGTVFLSERLDDRFRTRVDVEEKVGAPVLATVTRFDVRDVPGFPAPIVASRPKSTVSETYRALRTNIQFTMRQRNIKSLLITSPSSGEGKTITTANLGAAAAQAGTRVLLLSSDLRRPALETYFGVANKVGMSTWLAGHVTDLGAISQATTIPNLHLIPSGPLPPSPAELLASPRLRDLISSLEQAWDLVLLDSPPALPVADAMILASTVGGTLLVINAATTRRSAAAHGRGRLQSIGAEIIGSVLNEFEPSNAPFYHQAYYTDYRPEAVPKERANDGFGSQPTGPGHQSSLRSGRE
jgi:succinoglycan biosynthesis transport protein ExoP